MVLSQEMYIENLKMNKTSENRNIRVIQTRKYKDVNLYLRFSIEAKPLLKEKLAILCKLIGESSKKYNTKTKMARAKDMLYGISCSCSYKIRNNLATLSVHFSFINPKFLDCTIDEYTEFIKEVLYNSLINEETLNEAKKTIKAATLRKIEKPASKATNRFLEIVAKDNDEFLNYVEDNKYISNVKKLKLEDLVDEYRQIINKEQLHIYLCGDLNEKDINILTNFNFNNRKHICIKAKKCKYKEKKTIIDKQDISQSYLSVVYSTPFNKTHKDYFAWFMGNCYFGVLPTSLLFSQIREKMSLCYSITSIDYKNEGLIRVTTSIDGKNKDKAIKEINNQLNRMISGDYEEADLEVAKQLICNTIMGIYDDLDGLVNYYYESDISNFKYSIEEYCQNIMAVTKKDISRVFKKYNLYFNYILLGNKHE